MTRSEKRKTDNQKPKISRWQAITALSTVTLLACILITVGGFQIYQSDPDHYRQMAFGPFTLTAPPIIMVVTATPTITLTPSPTPVPPTSTVTPIPASRFLVDAASIYPPLPIGAEAVWIMNDQDAVVNPPLTDANVWVKETSTDQRANGEEYFHTTVGNAAITWNLDVPLNQGLYQLYVLDTKANSGGYGLQNFTVLLDNTPQTVPYRGLSDVIFNTVDGQQAADDWLPIGAYEIQQGQQLTVQVAVPALGPKLFFGLDRILVVKVSDSQRSMLDALPVGRPLVSLLDDTRATFYLHPAIGTRPLNERYQGQIQTDPLAWNGSFRSLPWSNELTLAVGNAILVKWLPLGRLSAGEYEVLIWVPAQHSTAQIAGLSLIVDGVELKPETPRPLDQKSYSGQWATLGSWKLDGDAAVGVQMTIEKQDGELGIDAVAILKVGP